MTKIQLTLNASEAPSLPVLWSLLNEVIKSPQLHIKASEGRLPVYRDGTVQEGRPFKLYSESGSLLGTIKIES